MGESATLQVLAMLHDTADALAAEKAELRQQLAECKAELATMHRALEWNISALPCDRCGRTDKRSGADTCPISDGCVSYIHWAGAMKLRADALSLPHAQAAAERWKAER